MKWLDGRHSDNEADTWPWLFALGANLAFVDLVTVNNCTAA